MLTSLSPHPVLQHARQGQEGSYSLIPSGHVLYACVCVAAYNAHVRV